MELLSFRAAQFLEDTPGHGHLHWCDIEVLPVNDIGIVNVFSRFHLLSNAPTRYLFLARTTSSDYRMKFQISSVKYQIVPHKQIKVNKSIQVRTS